MKSLVTTALPETIGISGDTLLLGQWCVPYHDCDSNLGPYHLSTLLPYHWDDRRKYYADYLYLSDLYEKVLEQLADRLSELHSIPTSISYWRVIIGPWLRFFTDVLFDRFESIRSAVIRWPSLQSQVLAYEKDRLTPADFIEFYQEAVEDEWNHMIYAECMAALDVASTLSGSLDYPRKTSTTQNESLWKNVWDKLVPDSLNDIVFVSPAVKSTQICRVQLLLGQLPWFYNPIRWHGKKEIDHKARQDLQIMPGETDFERFLAKMIKRCFPKIYLEEFSDFRLKVLSSFPDKPRAIYTGNAYQEDDGFKTWCAEQQEFHGVPLIIAQHGGNMGISRFNQTEDHQKLIAERFLTWGWNEGKNPNVIPFPALKLLPWKIKHNDSGKILLTTASYPRYFYCHYAVPIAGQYLEYINEQITFLARLVPDALDDILIRPDQDNFGWSFAARMKDAGFGTKIDGRNIPLSDALDNCRLVIGTTNSTIFLEALANNFPTVVYFNQDNFEIREEARDPITILQQCGIYHPSATSAASFVNSIHEHVGDWWSSKAVQAARSAFCRQYALSADVNLKTWSKMFEFVVKDAVTKQETH